MRWRFAPCVLARCAGGARRVFWLRCALVFWRCALALCVCGFGVARRRGAPFALARLRFWRCAPALCANGFGAARRRLAPSAGAVHRRCAPIVLATRSSNVRLHLALRAGAGRLLFWRCAPMFGIVPVLLEDWSTRYSGRRALELCAAALRFSFWRWAAALSASGFGAMRRCYAPFVLALRALVLALCAGVLHLLIWRRAPALCAF